MAKCLLNYEKGAKFRQIRSHWKTQGATVGQFEITQIAQRRNHTICIFV